MLRYKFARPVHDDPGLFESVLATGEWKRRYALEVTAKAHPKALEHSYGITVFDCLENAFAFADGYSWHTWSLMSGVAEDEVEVPGPRLAAPRLWEFSPDGDLTRGALRDHYGHIESWPRGTIHVESFTPKHLLLTCHGWPFGAKLLSLGVEQYLSYPVPTEMIK